MAISQRKTRATRKGIASCLRQFAMTKEGMSLRGRSIPLVIARSDSDEAISRKGIPSPFGLGMTKKDRLGMKKKE